MKRVRKFLVILMVVSGSFLLYGCHMWQPPSPPGVPPPPPIPVPGK
jgi:hypothetical protein